MTKLFGLKTSLLKSRDLGIAFISAHTVATELDERRLVTLDIDGLPIVRQWFVLSRKDKVLLPPAN